MQTAGTTSPHISAATVEDNAIRLRILRMFEELARTAGPRSVSMAQLARHLGLSTKTLYRHFPNKASIVSALVAGWAQTLHEDQSRRHTSEQDPKKRIEQAALHWLNHTSQFDQVFWIQLKRDFPDAHGIYRKAYGQFLARAQQSMIPTIRSDLNPQLALSALMRLINHATDPILCQQLNLTRKDALMQAIDLWAAGALKNAKGA